MANSAAETLIGAVVLVASAGFLVYAANTAEVTAGTGTYDLVAKFRKAEGVSSGGDVRIAGVKVGTIRSMDLDPATYSAVLTLSIRGGVALPEDTVAAIKMSSLLGDQFIALEPGASEDMLEGGDEITFTQSSLNLTDLIGTMVQGSGGG
ncbi:MAG: outer membrane lipid asymmetry maintenance protein MlaD [Paracoccaceae bacterium]